jgi:hypothetical protein
MTDYWFKVSKKVSFEELGGNERAVEITLIEWRESMEKEHPGYLFDPEVMLYRDEEGITLETFMKIYSDGG